MASGVAGCGRHGPVHREDLQVSILAGDGVDFDRRGTAPDLHDTAATFSFPVHAPRMPSQLVWNCVWNFCRGGLLVLVID